MSAVCVLAASLALHGGSVVRPALLRSTPVAMQLFGRGRAKRAVEAPEQITVGSALPDVVSSASACTASASQPSHTFRRSRASLHSVLRGRRSSTFYLTLTLNPDPDPYQEIEALLFQLPAETEEGAAQVTDVKAAVLPLTKARRMHFHRTCTAHACLCLALSLSWVAVATAVATAVAIAAAASI